MQFNHFTLFSALIMLVPVGMALTAGTHERVGPVIGRLFGASLGAVLAFGAVGGSILQGDPDILMSVDTTRLLFRGLDGAAFHHLTLSLVGAGLVAVTLRRSRPGSALLAGIIFGGLLFPAAAKLVWFGRLRRAGLIDIGGATAVLALAGAFAITLLRLTTGRIREEIARGSVVVPGLGGMMTIVGWCALLYTTGIMQSPATCTQGAMNGLRAAATAGLVAVIVIRVLRKDEGPLRVFAAIAMGVAATTALAGRAPAAAAVFLGAVTGIIAPPAVGRIRRLLGRGTSADPAIAIWMGSFVACVIAIPYAHEPGEMHAQLVIQLAAVVMASGVGVCAGILLSPIVRALDPRLPNDGQPIAAN